MALPEHALLWTTNSPAAWPDAPADMTVTTLVEIEECPRRWALGAAHYPDLWPGRGYPPRIQLSTLAGTVVHFTLEAITKGLVRAGCPTAQGPMAIEVMKDLGGYTKVVNACIDRLLERIANNPRAKRLHEYAGRSLRARVPDLRMRAQSMLCRMRLPHVAVSHSQGPRSTPRRALTIGVFPEIELHAREIGWKGKADLLVLSEGGCEITDFKTGTPGEGHHFQIQVYALLWSRDADLNPGRRVADRLTIEYDSGEVKVAAPTDSELVEIERDLILRSDAVRQAVTQVPPEARPDPKYCRYCGVRQLCNEYWTAETQRQMAEQVDSLRFADVQVRITGRHGPSSWDARIELSRNALAGKPAVLRTSGDVEFSAGDRLRVLDAAVTFDGEDETQPVIITLGQLSERYAVI